MSQEQPNNPLHGVTLKEILEYLVDELGWEQMAEEVPIRCFQYDPSIKSSLVFLRRTAWARNKVEAFYIKKVNTRSQHQVNNESGGSRGKYITRR